MLPLDDVRWGSLMGGYRVAYDASECLERMLNDGVSDALLFELGEELCHQGDLGSASYAAVPWLIEALRRCPNMHAGIVQLILTIEFGRPFNESVPDFLRDDYSQALRNLSGIVLSRRNHPWTEEQIRMAAAVLALSHGDRWLARTYYELDRSLLHAMLEQEFGSAEWDWP